MEEDPLLDRTPRSVVLVLVSLLLLPLPACGQRRARGLMARDLRTEARLAEACVRDGWEEVRLTVAGIERVVFWKGPAGRWSQGAIVVLHGGGGSAVHFCAGRRLVKPQVEFAQAALGRGFAVFLLDATTDRVTDAEGRPCGKRFDFSVLPRPNLDLPYIEQVVANVIPSRRPPDAHRAVFLTGLSTGGYMTTRAATTLGGSITAFAPISAGDPYGTDPVCDTSLSPRQSAKGVLIDRETGKRITEARACQASDYPKESPWPGSTPRRPFKQFQHEDDGIVDLSCMRKTATLLQRHGYPDAGAFVIDGTGRKDPFKHLWLDAYNEPLLDFFSAQGAQAAGLR
jgi:pimeloyl-ACP methyl ester carboxylesterase